MQRMVSLLLTIALLYAAIVAFMFIKQRQLMYYPDTMIEAPARYGLNGFEDLRITTADNVHVQLWYKPAAPGFPTIAYFHGNASHIGNRAGIYHALAEKGFGIAALSYRGYGRSEGAPTEAGIYNDARATLNFLSKDKNIHPSHIILYGESLGTGVAVQMATEYNVAGVVLQAAYTSTVNRAAEIYYWLPVKLVMLDRFDSLSKISRVKAPILMFHGELDQTIPIAHGKALYDIATAPKQFLAVPGAGHNDFDSNEISEHVFNFAKQYHLITAP